MKSDIKHAYSQHNFDMTDSPVYAVTNEFYYNCSYQASGVGLMHNR